MSQGRAPDETAAWRWQAPAQRVLPPQSPDPTRLGAQGFALASGQVSLPNPKSVPNGGVFICS